MNVLFIMTDQQRVDFLSVYGNRVLQTPAMDRIGREGTLFQNAFVQSAVCGPSRACFYTGRYVHTHRSAWNEVPLPITEKTAGHYFEEAGFRAAVVGKTHMYSEFPKPDFVKEECHSVDRRNLSRMDTVGFEYITGAVGTPCVPNYDYIEYLRKKGYPGNGQEIAFNTLRPAGKTRADNVAVNCRLPAAVKAEDSSAHYRTDRAIEFMKETTDRPWFLHLSYSHPHHPNCAPAPYNTMYSENDFEPPLRCEEELSHSFFNELRKERNINKGNTTDDNYCRHWRAVYAGLIKMIDDNLVRLFDFMDESGLMENTMIVFTSDHGELAGDHWFFEKDTCYRQCQQVPLLIRHPELLKENSISEFVESVDVLPTCLDAVELDISPGIQGKSLMPFLKGEQPSEWRKEMVAEYTYEYFGSASKMERQDCRAIMIRNKEFSFCHFNGPVDDLLFDLKKDPDELHNVAAKAEYAHAVTELKNKLLDWQLRNWDPLPLRLSGVWLGQRSAGPDVSELPYNAGRFM